MAKRKIRYKAIYTVGRDRKGASVFPYSFTTRKGARKASRVVTAQGYKIKVVPVKKRRRK